MRTNKNFDFSVGLGFSQARLGSTYNYLQLFTRQDTLIRYDTLGSYVILLPDKIEIVYSLDTIEVITQKQWSERQFLEKKQKIYSLFLPFVFSYFIDLKKFYLKPSTSILLVMNIQKSYFEYKNRIQSYRIACFPSIGIALGKILTPKLELELSYRQNFKLKSKTNFLNANSNQFSISCNYFFIKNLEQN
jgi:hypothetical protein